MAFFLQELGCQIAIDDFGTGYASYARLKNVNADLLKIDGSFIRNIVSNSLDYQWRKSAPPRRKVTGW